MRELPDIIDYNLILLFVGFNPGIRSSESGHHYAGKGNHFWRLLFEAGLTPYRFSPEEDRQLLKLRFGSTNIVSRPTKGASEIILQEFKEGRITLKKRIEEFKPKIICYVGIGVFKIFTGKKVVTCGIQEESEVEGTYDYVCSSPSGLNRISYHQQLDCFVGLKKLLDEVSQVL